MSDPVKIIIIVAILAIFFYTVGRFAKKSSKQEDNELQKDTDNLNVQAQLFDPLKFASSKVGTSGKTYPVQWYGDSAVSIKEAIGKTGGLVNWISEPEKVLTILRKLKSKNELLYLDNIISETYGESLLIKLKRIGSDSFLQSLNKIINTLK